MFMSWRERLCWRYHIEDKTNVHYISEDNFHIKRRFCKDELRLNVLFNMVLKSILTRFIGLIVLLVRTSINI